MKIILSFLLLPFFAYPASAQHKTQILSVLWRVQSPKTHQISYILGTNHLFGKKWIAAFPKIDSLLNGSSAFLCEITYTEKKPEASDTISHVHVKAKQIFGKDYDKVNQYFIKRTGEGLTENIDNDNDPASTFRNMQRFLLEDIAAQKELKVADVPVDFELLNQAKAKNKLCVQLDDDKMLKNIFLNESVTNDSAKPIIEMVDLLNHKETVRQTDDANNFLTELSLYNNGKFTFDFNTDGANGDKTAKSLTRNNLWMKKIPTYMDKGKVFMAVGAGHLTGKHGLIMQLKRLGYKLSPVNL